MFTAKTYISSISVEKYISQYRDSDKFIVFCKECNKYNNCWACPPYDFDTDQYISRYKNAYIIGTKLTPSQNIISVCTDAEKSKSAGAEIIAAARRELDVSLLLLESHFPDSKAFFAGTCHLCNTMNNTMDCTRISGKPCRYPEKIRHSLESLGFDIGKTTEKLLNIELKWSSDGSLPEYLALVSALFTNSVIDGIENYFIEK